MNKNIENTYGDSLLTLRQNFAKIAQVILAANVVIIVVMGMFFETNFMVNVGLSLFLAILGLVSILKNSTAPLTRYITSAALAGQVAVCVNVAAATNFQIDIHMYFFAILAILAGWCDWRAIVVYSTVVAVHHLSLNFVYPAAIFPYGSDFGRVALHAVIVVVESAILVWLIKNLQEAIEKSDAATREANQQKATANERSELVEGLLTTLTEREVKVSKLIEDYKTNVTAAYTDVQETAKEMNSMSSDLSMLAQEASTEMSNAASSTKIASENVSSAATASVQLSQSIADMTSRSENAKTAVTKGTKAVNGMRSSVNELATSAKKIGEVISLIQDIAEQTNLLALNATIEAARAGEMGRGFAVVASEVKTLATQTAKATDEISSQITSIQTSTGDTVQDIENIVELMGGVDELTISIAKEIIEQGTATNEISENAKATETLTNTLHSNIETVRSGVEQTHNIASSVRTTSQKVSIANEKINSLTATFLEEIETLSKEKAA